MKRKNGLKVLIKRIFIVLVVTISVVNSNPLFAQKNDKDDFGMWFVAQMTKNWDNGLYIAMRGEFRTKEMGGKMDITYLRPTFGYAPLKWLKIDVAYDIMLLSSGALRHDFLFSVTGTLSKENLSVSVRERYMLAYNQKEKTYTNVIRSFLRAQYKAGCCTPYLALEIFSWSKWNMTQYFVGTEIAFAKHSSFDIFYMYNSYASKPQAQHTAGLGYLLKL